VSNLAFARQHNNAVVLMYLNIGRTYRFK